MNLTKNNIIMIFISLIIIYFLFFYEKFTNNTCPPSNNTNIKWTLIGKRCGLNCVNKKTKNATIQVGTKFCTGTQTAKL